MIAVTVPAITSTSVAEPIGGLVLSNAVRRAVIGLVKTVAEEWAPDVRANAVLPGPHETDRLRNLVEASVERGEYEDYEAGPRSRRPTAAAGSRWVDRVILTTS